MSPYSFFCSRSETSYIAKNIGTLNCKLDLKRPGTSAHLDGLKTQAEGINSLLKDEQSGAEVGIFLLGSKWQVEMLWRYFYNSNKQTFERNSFHTEMGKHTKSNLVPLYFTRVRG